MHWSFSEQFAWTWTGTVLDNRLPKYLFGNRYSHSHVNNFTAASEFSSQEESAVCTVLTDSSKNELPEN